MSKTFETARFWLDANFRKFVREVVVPASAPVIDTVALPVEWAHGKLSLCRRTLRRCLPRPAVDSAKATRGGEGGEREVAPSSRPARLRVAAIMDTFSMACFGPDAELVTFFPDDFEEVLERWRPDLLLVESAWHGNSGKWTGRIALSPNQFLGELKRLVRWCQAKGIPTAFRSIEDPIHFQRFLRAASWFESVHTTDAACIPAYQKQFGHQRVFASPFAAQPAIHNPLGASRTLPVCFAGTYWADRYPERQAQIEILLKPAMDFGLQIFDRHFGRRGRLALRHRFPEIYQPAIQGALNYPEMLRAYRRYRVFLNVNTVTDSPTMFSMRVFEILACGTPVISTYARGIAEILGEDVVAFSSSAAETRRHLERLLGDEEHWARTSLLGLRRVLGEHTYGDRLRAISASAGVGWKGGAEERLGCLALIRDSAETRWLRATLERQTCSPTWIGVLDATASATEELAGLQARFPRSTVRFLAGSLASEPERLLEVLSQVPADRLACLLPGHCYGSHFLEDYQLATRFSSAEVFGKSTHFRFRPGGRTELFQPGQEYQIVPSVPAATAAVRISALSADALVRLLAAEAFAAPGRGTCLSLDRFNYVADLTEQNAGECNLAGIFGKVDI